jgi:3-polyprenyl-4-hydroxybenzoate decarboxylase
VIMPPALGFYNRPGSVDEIVNHLVMRILDQVDVHLDLAPRWDGEMK